MTGVVLANASVDVAMHDTYTTFIFINNGALIASGAFVAVPNNSETVPLSPFELSAFFVGLLDGDGSLQVNHWRSKNLQFRLVIKLANHIGNLYMLQRLCDAFGGKLRFAESGKSIIWVIDNKETLINVILPILAQFPPLTTRVTLQLAFILKAIAGITMEEYFATRGSIMDQQKELGPLIHVGSIPTYFSLWLAGFIEAEGSFYVRTNGTFGFGIGQAHDRYILEAILLYYEQAHKVSVRHYLLRSGKPFYEIQIGSASGVSAVVRHCMPLLQGHKLVQLNAFLAKKPSLRPLLMIQCHA